MGPGADYIYYDPWRRVSISEDQAKHQLLGERRTIPDGHPVWWDHSSIPDECWAATTLAGPVEQVPGTGWAADVPEEAPTTNLSGDLSLQGPLE